MLLPGGGTLAAGLTRENGSSGMQRPDGFQGLSGSWSMDEPITSRASGDGFALSSTKAESFVYEADVTFADRTGAASLVFYASDDPAKGSYVANLDLSQQNARIFRFEAGGGATTKGEFRLTEAMKRKSQFHLRVESDGTFILYLIDGVPAVVLREEGKKPGNRLGLLTFNTGVDYAGVGYAPLDSDAPCLTRLTGASVPFTGQLSLKDRLPYGTDTRVYDFTSNGTVTASLTGGSGTVILQAGQVTVRDICGDYELLITVTKNNLSRSYRIGGEMEKDPAMIYNEFYRPQIHFSPLVNWMNDPNGLVYDPEQGIYHLFFQYNPSGLNIANQVWGHAWSKDLVHWKEVDIALPQDHLGAVFSGSAVVDSENTSGFFTDNKPGETKLVAVYTSDGGDTTHGVEKQCIAYSKDGGLTWIRPTVEKDGFENPILPNDNDKYGRDFRDPKIFRYDGRWFMAVAGGRARLFASEDLIHWTKVCDMGMDSECPDFYPLAVDGNADNVKWVYTASGKWYVVGRLEKVNETSYRFVAESERLPYNGGGEVYATQSYYNDGSGQDRRIAISWIQDSSAFSLTGKGWNGAMTLPYEQTLRTVNGKIRLISYPVAEVDRLRKEEIVTRKENGLGADAINEELKQHPGNGFDLILAYRAEKDTVFSLELLSDGVHKTVVTYDGGAGMLRVNRSQAGSATGVPVGIMEMPLTPDAEGVVTLRILADKSIVEVFGNEGEVALAGMVFPDADGIGLGFTDSGSGCPLSLQMWRIGSIHHSDATVLPAPGLYFTASSSHVAMDEITAVTVYGMNEAGTAVTDGIAWAEVDSDLVEVVGQTGTTLLLKGKKEGTLTLTATGNGRIAQKTLAVADASFKTDLKGWQSKGDWYETVGGYGLAGSNGDSFAFADAKNSGSFTYSGIADFKGQKGCLGLVFGVTDPAMPSRGTWFGANIDTHGERPVMKLFANTRGQETWNETYTFASFEDCWELSVTYNADTRTLSYTVNGETVTHRVTNLKEGRLGLVSWNGGGFFDHVIYRGEEPEVPVAPDTSDDTTQAGGSEVRPGTEVPETQPEAPVTSEPSANDSGTSSKPGARRTLWPYVVGSLAALASVGAVIGWVFAKKKRR